MRSRFETIEHSCEIHIVKSLPFGVFVVFLSLNTKKSCDELSLKILREMKGSRAQEIVDIIKFNNYTNNE